MTQPISSAAPRARAIGILCGIGAALCWAAGFAIAKRGIALGMAPADLALHRFLWTGLALLPLLLRTGLSDLGGVGWGRGIVMMLLGGPVQAFLAYFGFTLVPLGHGAVIQPATAALMGVILSALVLHEWLSPARIFGLAAILAGLAIFGAEALTTIGSHGLGGDLLFILTGSMWAGFAILLRLWSVEGMRATTIVSVLSVFFYAPLHAIFFGYDRMIAMGLYENLLQAVVQGGLAGALPIYLFARAVTSLGPSRASMFPALVPVFAMLLGIVVVDEIPSVTRLVGLAVVLIGFRFALKN